VTKVFATITPEAFAVSVMIAMLFCIVVSL
jgi:hypothetical protein